MTNSNMSNMSNIVSIYQQLSYSNMNNTPVMCVYIWGFIYALCIMLCWICIYGMRTRSQANVG